MLFSKVIPAGASALLCLASTAFAVSISNREDTAQTLTVIAGEARESHVIKPAETLDGVCKNGCLLRLNNDMRDDPYELQGSDVVSIENGELWLEDAGEASAPPSGAGKMSR